MCTETKIGFNDLFDLFDVHRFPVMPLQDYRGGVLLDALVFFASTVSSQSEKEEKMSIWSGFSCENIELFFKEQGKKGIDIRICGFDEVFNSFSTKNPSTVEDKKVRDKYTEILDAIGIDKKLLRAKEKVTDIYGRTVRSDAYIFPEQSVDFCATVIQKYTSCDFKKLRKAAFDEMTIDEVVFLVQGFSIMLCNLGHPKKIVLEQYNVMERRMAYKLRLATKRFECQLDAIHELAKKYKRRDINFFYYDKIYFLRYMAAKVEATRCYIESVYGSYTDIRSNELSDIALEESYKESPQISTERINKEMIYFDVLEHDDEYQKLLQQQEKLIAEDTFIKSKQKRLKKIQKRFEEIQKQHQMGLFGKLLDEREDVPLIVRHPMDVLKEAVEDAEDWIKNHAERDEAEAAKTPEDIEREKADMERIQQWFEEHGMNLNLNCDLPNTDEQEEEIFVQSGNLLWEVKGTIHFPCYCKKGQVTAYKGIKGKCAMKCPECGYYVLIDYDKMTAKPLELHGPVRRIEK